MTSILTPGSEAAFRNRDRPTYVYQLWTYDERCLYVGMTVNIGGRLSQHKGQHWWRQVGRIVADIYPDRESAHEAEIALIVDHDPPHNTKHTERALKAHL